MGKTLHPLKDSMPIPLKAKRSLKKQMARWLRRLGKESPDQGRRTPRHRGWYW
jgi:hypothetical protein